MLFPSLSRAFPRLARPSSLIAAYAWIAVCLVSGCSNEPTLLPVTGTVSLDGQPLPFKNLMFIPEGGTAGNGAGGFTDGQGHYTLKAVMFGATRDYAGCPPGHYRVLVLEPTIPISAKDFEADESEGADDEPEAAVGPVAPSRKHAIPVIYTQAETTPLQVEVSEADGGVRNLELSSQGR